MGTTATTKNVYPNGWATNVVSTDLSGCEEIRAAPGAGLRLALSRLWVDCQNAGGLVAVLGAGETAGAVTAALINSIVLANGVSHRMEFQRPILLPENTSLTMDAVGAGNTTIWAEGYVVEA